MKLHDFYFFEKFVKRNCESRDFYFESFKFMNATVFLFALIRAILILYVVKGNLLYHIYSTSNYRRRLCGCTRCGGLHHVHLVDFVDRLCVSDYSGTL